MSNTSSALRPRRVTLHPHEWALIRRRRLGLNQNTLASAVRRSNVRLSRIEAGTLSDEEVLMAMHRAMDEVEARDATPEASTPDA